MVLVALAVVLTAVTPVLDVRTVRVDGPSEETRPQVEAAAAVAPGTSLVWMDTGEVAARVNHLPRIASVDVRRALPGTVVVTVTERTPVVAVPVPGGSALVDGSGFAYRVVATPPDGLPVLRLPPSVAPTPQDPATGTAVRVVGALPPDLAGQVAEVRATGPHDVALDLTDGREVRWGADTDDARKVAVLRALLTRPGHTYDVSAPELPVVS